MPFQATGGLPAMDKPLWDGSALDGKTILLTPEQGLGDTVQFIRYAAWLKDRYDCRVLVICQPELRRLLASCPGVDGWAQPGSVPAYDWFAPLMHVPAALRHAQFPADVPYLSAERELVARWGSRLPARAVGVAWRGNPLNATNLLRSIPLEAFAPLATVRPLVSLQQGSDETLPGMMTLDLDQQGAFVDSAAVLKNLDLLITCDTAIAHVAGALGVPVWLALCKVPDWRWGLAGETTPWYPTMRLFRQSTSGDWPGVMRQIAEALAAEV